MEYFAIAEDFGTHPVNVGMLVGVWRAPMAGHFFTGPGPSYLVELDRQDGGLCYYATQIDYVVAPQTAAISREQAEKVATALADGLPIRSGHTRLTWFVPNGGFGTKDHTQDQPAEGRLCYVVRFGTTKSETLVAISAVDGSCQGGYIGRGAIEEPPG